MNKRLMVGRAAFIMLLVIVTYLSVAPNPESGGSGFFATKMVAAFLFGDAAYADKIGHFCAYAALGFAARFSVSTLRQWWPEAFMLAAYGVALEGVQYFLDARSADLVDAIANGLGAVAGIGVASVLLKLLPAGRPA